MFTTLIGRAITELDVKYCGLLGGKYAVVEMLPNKRSQREGIDAANVGPMDASKPTI